MSKKSVHLPQDLIIEILLRLAVKALLRCKCVCKTWFSLITNSDFAISHFQLAASPTNKILRLENTLETLSIDFNASLNHESSYASLSLDFLPPNSYPEIGGSCRGFIFLYTYTDFLYLWNPSTGVHKTIPASPIVFNNSNLDISLYGFAYDHLTDDYLIILASTDRRSCDYYLVSTIIYFEIFSLRANKWKLIEIDFQVILYFECDAEVGLLWNDSIHWTAYNDHTNRDVIIAFDFRESRMSEIALPNGFHGNDYNLLVLDGLISAWVVEMHMVKIWVMKIYAVHSSWTKIIEFSVDHALQRSLSIVCFTNSGDIIGRDDEGGLMKFNDKGHLLEHHSGPKSIDSTYRFQMPLYTELYTESLLSLPA